MKRCAGILWCVIALVCNAVHAQSKEYQIKAAFLFNFTQFVEWPAVAFSGADAPLCVGVLGDDPFGPALEETFRGESVQNHKLSVRHAQKVEDLADCQMVFVSKSENARVSEILAKFDSRPVVTVSEVDGFARRGGTIDFYRENNKVRFEINLGSARQSGLKISSQLLGLGKLVQTAQAAK